MKQISIFVLGLVTALASVSASAQDFTAGKTPAQLFSSDCAECHRSPNGLARNRDVRMLAGFLREHYTTKSDTAGALAAYVSGFAGGAANGRNRGTGAVAPFNASGERPPAERRRRSEGEVTATGEDSRANASFSTADPLEDLSGRRRRTSGLPGDGEKRRARGDGEAPRPPGTIATATAARSAAPARDGARREAADPISRLRAYLSSGLGSESAIAEAAKTGTAAKARKRRNNPDSRNNPDNGELATTSDAPATARAQANRTPAGKAEPGASPVATGPAAVEPTAGVTPEGNAAATPARAEQQ